MTKSTKRIPRAQRVTPRAQPEPYAYEGVPYVRPPLSQLLLRHAEFWGVPDDLEAPHITAAGHMMILDKANPDKVETFDQLANSAYFEWRSWLCLFEANFQLTDGEG